MSDIAKKLLLRWELSFHSYLGRFALSDFNGGARTIMVY
jgi:hypothetical protein